MGFASIIAAGMVILLLVIVAYYFIGTTLVTAEVLAEAQSDLSGSQEERMRTSIDIVNKSVNNYTKSVFLEVQNTGSEIVGDFDYMEVYLLESGSPARYPYGTGPGTWGLIGIQPDIIHPQMLDADEVMNISVNYSGNAPSWAQVTTSNGVYDSVYL